MKANSKNYSVEKMCQVFKVSRSGYYASKSRKASPRLLETQELKNAIEKIHQQSKFRYGSPKITMELKSTGWFVSRPRVARIMKRTGLKSIVNRKFRCTTTDSNHRLPICENHLNRDFKANRMVEKWVSDITYIRTQQGWLYLTIVMDLFDRKIIGWALSTTMTTQDTVLAAWRMAVKNRPIEKSLIFHSDRGVQYASDAFTSELKRNSVIQSMSRKGNCWDNAVAENFFKILKSEMVYQTTYQSVLHAKTDVFEFIEIWYNRTRKHSYLGYNTPEMYGKIKYSKCA